MSVSDNRKEFKIRFKGDGADPFLAEVRQRVDRYFASSGKAKTAPWTVHLKAIALSGSLVLIWLTLLNGWLEWMPRMLLWMALGVNQAFIAVNIGHDALHGSFSNSPWLNRLLGYLAYDCVGLSSWIWKQTHNKEHHTYTNIAGADPDINKPGLIRLSPHDPYYKFHRFQFIYIWLLYALVGLNWVWYSDYTELWKRRHAVPKSEIAPFFLFKAVNLSVMLFIPLLFSPMPWWQTLLGYLCLQFAGGFAVAVIFQLAHVVENVTFPLPTEEGVIEKSWSAHEMETTANFATHSALVTHIVGGLNFQIEHHLFPKISHGHYQEISRIVRQTAHEHRLPYHENGSFTKAVLSHARQLKKLGATDQRLRAKSNSGVV